MNRRFGRVDAWSVVGAMLAASSALASSPDCAPDAYRALRGPYLGHAVSTSDSDQVAWVSPTNFGAVAQGEQIEEITVELWAKPESVNRSYLFNNIAFCFNQGQCSAVLPQPIAIMSAHLPWVDGRIYWDFGNPAGGGRISAALPKA